MKTSPKSVVTALIALAVALGLYFYFKPQSVFVKYCQERLEQQKLNTSLKSSLCKQLEKKLYSSLQPVQELPPTQVNAPSLPIDSRVRFLVFHHPYYFSHFAYCYFAFRGWFDPSTLSPQQMAMAASGFAILRSELNGYKDWLDSEMGEKCQSSLRSSTQLNVADLETEMGNKISLIGFNPVGAIAADKGIGEILAEAKLTFNHERIHVIHVSCSDVDKSAIKYWNSLSQKQKEELKEKHPNYDWSNKLVAIREAYAYLHEASPEKVLADSGTCFSH